MIDPLVRERRWLLIAVVTQLVYGLGEVGDSLYLLLMQAHLLPNLYPVWTFSEIEDLMNRQPGCLFPVFAFFAAGRLLAAYGLFHNRLWGFWLTIFVSSATVALAIFFLPLGGFDMLMCLFIVCVLLIDHYSDKPYISK
jgi:uncharacterized membrane protein (DUF2068 family)